MMTEQAAPQCYRHPGRHTWISCQRCGRPICPDCMVPAAVGFQCPSCVHEARKTVRQARTAFGGRIPVQPGQTTIVLIAINAVVWLLTVLTGGYSSRLYQAFAQRTQGSCVDASGQGFFRGVPHDVCSSVGEGAHWVAGVTDGAPWQIITSAFSHVEVWHIASNMLALWFVGPALEAAFGRARFLTLYVVSALGGSLMVLLFTSPQTPTLGASGAIFGLFGALLILSRRTPALFNQVAVLVVINLVVTFAVPGISWEGHIGGLVAGLLTTGLFLQWNARQRASRTRGL